MSAVKWIFNQSLRLKYCFKHFREFITMFFRKINKFDYFVFKIYRLIALFNTLNKIMKSIITTRLSYAAKEHNLLLREHFERRKDIVSKHALHYIIETINSIWVNKKIAIMLLLNVIEVFDNVSHLRLLHDLRKRRIENIYLIWVKSFFFERYIILKLIDHIIDRIRIVINVFQRFSMSSILYVFYNADLIDWCINSQINIIEANFIDDIKILIMSDSVEENVVSLKTIHVESCMIWAHQHDSLFVSIKYELIHFRRLFALSNSKMILRILDYQIASSFKCKYLKMIMNCQLIWKHHLKKVVQQTEYFVDFSRIHLKSEHQRSSSHLFNHRTVSIHLLCLDLIRSQWRTRLQAKKKCRTDLYEKHSNQSDSNYYKDFHIHRRNRAECKTLFILDTSTVKHDHLQRVITFDHQFDISLH
jgi:hypothetical protein